MAVESDGKPRVYGAFPRSRAIAGGPSSPRATATAAATHRSRSEGLLEQQVQNDPHAIGFLSNYRADQGAVNPVAFNGAACTLANATSGQYAAVAKFYEVTKGPATGAAAKFISWIRTSRAAKKIISTQWIPA